MKSKSLKIKDIATIGIFSVILFVITVLVGAVTGMSMTLYMFSVSFVALLSAPFFMLIMTKVHKKGAVFITFTIVGILWALVGGVFVLIWMLILGIVAEWIACRSDYHNFKSLVFSYILYAAAYWGGAIAPLYYYSKYYFSHGYTKEATYALINAAHSMAGYIGIVAMFAAAVIGAFMARALLKKHFEKAGVI